MKKIKLSKIKLFPNVFTGFLLLLLIGVAIDFLLKNTRFALMLENIIGLMIGIFISTIMSILTYYSWVLDENEFTEWLRDQNFRVTNPARTTGFSKSFRLWYARMSGPIVAIFGLAISIFMAVKFFQ